MEGKGFRFIKGLMIFLNVIVLICGITLLGVGIWVYVNGESFREVVLANYDLFQSVIVIIVVGAILTLSGFFGCLGAVKESRCLLGLYFTILAFLFIAEIVVVILIFVYYPQVREIAIDSLARNDTSSSTSNVWDSLQSFFKCCGFNNSSDWGPNLPESCCMNTTVTCTFSLAYPDGCEGAIRPYFWVLGGVAIAVLAFELLAMIFTGCLYRGVAGNYELA